MWRTPHATTRLLIHLARSPGKGILRAEFPGTPQLTPSPDPSWVDALRPLDSSISWSIYTDASRRAAPPRPRRSSDSTAPTTVAEPYSSLRTIRTGARICWPCASRSHRLSLPSGARHWSRNCSRFRLASNFSIHYTYGHRLL